MWLIGVLTKRYSIAVSQQNLEYEVSHDSSWLYRQSETAKYISKLSSFHFTTLAEARLPVNS